MNVGYSQSKSELNFANAFTNNTFDLKETERSLRNAMENSFNYLKGLQRSYIDVHRFNLTDEDMFIDYGNKICVSLDKDFIEANKRKEYKISKFYGKFITAYDVSNNPSIFSYVPIIILDGQCIFSYDIKCTLDGNTLLRFNHVEYIRIFMSQKHTLEVLFLKNEHFHTFTTNYYSLEHHSWELPQSVTGIKINEKRDVFLFVKDTEENSGTNIFYSYINDDGRLVIDKTNQLLYDYIKSHRVIEVFLYSPDDLIQVGDFKQINTRIDNGINSSIVVLCDKNNQAFNMPIDTRNLVVISRNKSTGELKYENNLNIVLHYPNIYEIISDYLPGEYEYKVFYFYRSMYGHLKFRNHFKYIHNYFRRKFDAGLEECVCSMLYTTIVNADLQNYFFSIFDYEDADYIYNHGDFFVTERPYNFDYKVDKMNAFIANDPIILKDYAENVCNEFTSYFLYVANIDLDKRLRNDTYQEAEKDFDKIVFDESHYVFTFRNESSDMLHLRFFIDGILCTTIRQFHIKDMEYIYIPTRYINNDSYIEVERFYEYQYIKTIKFDNETEHVDLEFSNQENINPTLFDLFITDTNGVKIPRKSIGIYMRVEKALFDMSDELQQDDLVGLLMNNGIYEDPETGYLFIDVDEAFVSDTAIMLDDTIVDADGRLPLAYAKLEYIRLVCRDDNYKDKDINVVINKIPFIKHVEMISDGLMSIPLFDQTFRWNTSEKYLRVFVDGKLSNIPFDLYETHRNGATIASRAMLKKGEVFTADISTFAYDLEYTLDEVPENFVISFEGKLSKPFSTKYYDIYLNGRKLSDYNLQLLTPDKIKLFNVNSRNCLKVFRRDRDIEFYGFQTQMLIPVDEILNSEVVSDDDKDSIIDDIIGDSNRDHPIVKGDNTETPLPEREPVPDELLSYYRFYMDVIIPEGVAKPNQLLLNRDYISLRYYYVYEKYSNMNDRIVIRPNINHDSSTILMIGKKSL